MQARSTIADFPRYGVGVTGPPLTVTYFLKKLRGGSQSNLVRCSDGKLYVLKLASNPQGSQSLANEVMGAHLMQGLGLPIPPWRLVVLTRQVIKAFPALRTVGLDQIARNPEEGEHFASEFLLKAGCELFDTPWKSGPPTALNPHTALMYVFDLWSCHRDWRQCVFRRDRSTGSWETFFIDNGLLFGGPEWDVSLSAPAVARSNHFTLPAIDDPGIRVAVDLLTRDVPRILSQAAMGVPPSWIKGNLTVLHSSLLERLRHLDSLVTSDLVRYAESIVRRSAEHARYLHSAANNETRDLEDDPVLLPVF